jgi:hypothetical protein
LHFPHERVAGAVTPGTPSSINLGKIMSIGHRDWAVVDQLLVEVV